MNKTIVRIKSLYPFKGNCKCSKCKNNIPAGQAYVRISRACGDGFWRTNEMILVLCEVCILEMNNNLKITKKNKQTLYNDEFKKRILKKMGKENE